MFMTKRDRVRMEYLEEEVKRLRSQLETVLAHAVCAGWEIKSLQERLNSKNNQTKKRKVQVNAQYVLSAEAIWILDGRERADAEKRQKEEEAQAAKKAKDDQRKQQREAGGITFSGSLNNKTRDDLLDISFALRLTSSDSNMPEIKTTLVTMINSTTTLIWHPIRLSLASSSLGPADANGTQTMRMWPPHLPLL